MAWKASSCLVSLLDLLLIGQSTVIAFNTAFDAVAIVFVVAAPILIAVTIVLSKDREELIANGAHAVDRPAMALLPARLLRASQYGGVPRRSPYLRRAVSSAPHRSPSKGVPRQRRGERIAIWNSIESAQAREQAAKTVSVSCQKPTPIRVLFACFPASSRDTPHKEKPRKSSRFSAALNWSGRRDSNPRPQPWQGCALPLSYARTGGPAAPEGGGGAGGIILAEARFAREAGVGLTARPPPVKRGGPCPSPPSSSWSA
jgi:hypothetical protein